MFTTFALLMVTGAVVNGYVRHANSFRQICSHMQTTSESPINDRALTLKGISNLFRSVGGALIVSAVVKSPASAKTFFDTDVYGDKELKIATVNKIKQKIRNAILADPSLAPVLLELAISDALGYDFNSGNGGQDGSIFFEIPKEGAPDLDKAVKALKVIQKELQRTNTVSFGDLVSFGGGEALESAGCGRVIVQVGRYEIKAPNTGSSPLNWESLTTDDVKSSFTKSGLDSQQIALLLGALGEVKRVVSDTLSSTKSSANEDDDEEEEDDQPFVPTTFGTRDAIFGAKLGKADFGSKYLASLIKNKNTATDNLSSILLGDNQVKSFVQKYATNEAAFLKDVPEAYLRMTLLGQEYTTRNS
eukprot:gene6885-13961_t